ncbi:hypothetical protein U1Q18_052468 [Sarracenia purpurea var. burkii]
MSIALDNTRGYSSTSTRSRRGMEGSRFMHGNGMSCVSSFDSPPPDLLPGDQNQEQKQGAFSDSSPSSSIGKNSDVSGMLSSDGEDSGDTTTEVQSVYKGGPLDSLDALEEVLPFRRGISRFYNGKSKSFASLAFASSFSSIQDVAKSENAYTRRRRNLIASSLAWDKNRTSPLRSNSAAGGISKRLTNLSRSRLALAVAMSTSDSNSRCDGVFDSNMNLISTGPSSPPLRRPQAFVADENTSLSPHFPRHLSAWRSFSLADLQCASATTAHTSADDIPNPSP